MIVLQAYRYELAPTKHEEECLLRHAGTARFAYNWAIERCRRALAERERPPSGWALCHEWNVWKRTNAPWWKEVSKCAPQGAFRNVQRAYENWRSGRAHEPRYHRRKAKDSFRLDGSIRVADGRVQLPRIGAVRTKETTVKFRGRILSATIRREVDRWFVSLNVERERTDPVPILGPAVGIDLGLTSFAVMSDGTRIESPKALENSLDRLRKRSKALSRKEPDLEIKQRVLAPWHASTIVFCRVSESAAASRAALYGGVSTAANTVRKPKPQ